MVTANGCGPQEERSASPDEISVAELQARVDTGLPVYLIDVRTEAEYQNERLAFTDDRIPYDSIPFLKERLPKDSKTEIYLFCRSGRRSAIAADMLRQMGYPNAFNVTGGIIAWKAAGYKTVSDY